MKIPTLLGGLLATSAAAQECITPPTALFKPVMDPNYTSTLLVDGLKAPRDMVFDVTGKLLIVDKGVGVKLITFKELPCDNVCVSSITTIIEDPSLNHGIALPQDQWFGWLYASNSNNVYEYWYNVSDGHASGGGLFMGNMGNAGNGGHSTRNLLYAQSGAFDHLLVSRGSEGNVDLLATNASTGHATIKYFDMYDLSMARPSAPADFIRDGQVLGKGLRNSVGIAKHPITDVIWSVENSMDGVSRLGVDVHDNNPGEELNYHGDLRDPSTNPFVGRNYGYPSCTAVWDPSTLQNPELKQGQQFYPNAINGSTMVGFDRICSSSNYEAPRVVLPAHTAPLGIEFLPDGSAAFISLHGSWDRTPPDGYRVIRIDFGPDGQPTSMPLAGVNIMANPDNTKCPGGCFRPTGLAIDKKGRVFMSSDATGEIYMIKKLIDVEHSDPGCTPRDGNHGPRGRF
ncbi:hypothetical protein GE09DRAFT_683719 [Coniochaeta sp. 2T2.1]|nr:hypothetical protein GE09DRAFT_683719 [Coniochaeta sp. 2T2.1]